MKVLMTTDEIISLENVRRVERRVTESKHTSYGKPYIVKHYEILIAYTDGQAEPICCGEDAYGEKACAEYFKTIYEKLSED